MCGIAGVFQQPAERTVGEMIKNLSHRGPDGRGITSVDNGTLGHARLAILDVEGGHQPMDYQDTSIVFNGEIYNYRKLRQMHLADLPVRTHSPPRFCHPAWTGLLRFRKRLTRLRSTLATAM